jgi:hypothetical protein
MRYRKHSDAWPGYGQTIANAKNDQKCLKKWMRYRKHSDAWPGYGQTIESNHEDYG